MSLFSKINTSLELITTNSWLKRKFLVKYGYRPEAPREKDLKFSESHLAVTPMSENPSLKKYFKQISNQYSLSSCVGNATADAFEAQIAHRNNISPDNVKDLSRLFIYWNARNLQNPPGGSSDDGTYIRLAFDSMARYGAPYEDIYPYNENVVNERPDILAYREAIKNRINKFYRIDGTGQERIGQIKQSLCSGNPVVFGTQIGNNFMNYIGNDEIIYDQFGGYLGGHAEVVVGYSDAKKAFEVRNSWGESWGNKGYCWLDQDYLAADITSDIWVPTI